MCKLQVKTELICRHLKITFLVQGLPDQVVTAIFKSIHRASYFALDLNVRFSHLLGILKLKKYLKIRFTGTTLHILKRIRLNYFRLNSSIYSQLYWSTEAFPAQIFTQRQQLLRKQNKTTHYFRLWKKRRNEFNMWLKQFYKV